jgi:hypothetical protein
LSSADAHQTRVRCVASYCTASLSRTLSHSVVYSDGRRRDLDPQIGYLDLIQQIQSCVVAVALLSRPF